MKSIVFATTASIFAFAANAETHSLSGEWKFARDWSGGKSVDESKASFADGSWETVRVPHDWGLAKFYPDGWGDAGKLDWWGMGWYRRKFGVGNEELGVGVKAYLVFDGVMCRPKVWVNGAFAGEWDYGYMSFMLDVTKLVKEGENVIAVHCDTTTLGTRWYPGAGIYRNVRLVVRKTGESVPGSVFVRATELTKGKARVRATWDSVGGGTGEREWTIENPRLWDVDDPYLYEAEIAGEKVRYGLRTAEWTADDGFHLNGRRVQLKGANLHHDLGPLGAAFNKSAARRQLARMKDMGCNAIRFSHNPPAPEMLDLCDEMGLLVWDECFDKWDGTSHRLKDENLEEYVTRNLRTFVRRDRNHPSVVAWSVFNEIMELGVAGGSRIDPAGITRERLDLFKGVVKSEDPTRAVGCANMACQMQFVEMGLQDGMDVVGWNYYRCYRPMRKANPKMPLVITESASAFSTFGEYSGGPAKSVKGWNENALSCDSYDHTAGCEIAPVDFAWVEADKYIAGEFVWTGIDYLGEPVPFNTKARSSYFGCCTLAGYPKDRFYLYRSHWNDKSDTLHVLPHWNWKEGDNVPVYVYTNGDTAELFLNGKSLGKKAKRKDVEPVDEKDPRYHDIIDRYALRWLDVPYAPGELRVVAWDSERKIGETTMRTAREARAVKLTAESDSLAGDDVAFVRIDIVDAAGTRLPLADDDIRLTLDGPGEIVAACNASEKDFQSFKETSHVRLFNGIASAVVRRIGEGAITLVASRDGLEEGKVVFK